MNADTDWATGNAKKEATIASFAGSDDLFAQAASFPIRKPINPQHYRRAKPTEVKVSFCDKRKTKTTSKCCKRWINYPDKPISGDTVGDISTRHPLAWRLLAKGKRDPRRGDGGYK